MQDQKSKAENGKNSSLPAIPEKLYFTIGEIAKLCDLKTHVLRYWEQEFEQLRPSKRRGNRRYYQRKDIILIRQIKTLLYDKGFTIEGARSQLGTGHTEQSTSDFAHDLITQTIVDLENLLAEIEYRVDSLS